MKPDKLYVELPPFTGRNVPIAEIARAMHKDAQYVRVGLQRGIFHFGIVYRQLAVSAANNGLYLSVFKLTRQDESFVKDNGQHTI